MFYEQANAALNSNHSEGWLQVAKHLNMSVQQLQTKLEQRSLTFEECVQLTRFSKSPELLIYVMSLFDQDFGFRRQVTTRSEPSARMN